MARIADVIVNLTPRNLNKSFSYLLPEDLAQVGVGWRVLVPFGSRKAEGFVVSLAEGDPEGLKSVLDALDDEPWFDRHMLELASWLSSYYLCSPADAMRLFIPGKAGVKSSTVYRAGGVRAAEGQSGPDALRPFCRDILAFLQDSGPKTLPHLAGRFGGEAEGALRLLIRQGLVHKEVTTRHTAKPRYRTDWRLAIGRDEAEELLAGLKGKPAQARLLAELLRQDRLTPERLKELKLTNATVQSAAGAGWATAEKVRLYRDSYCGDRCAAGRLNLMDQQRAALAEIVPALTGGKHASFLLHGVTGSGKTQVYIEATAEARRQNRQAVILVPEIALTGQIVNRFKERFGDDVVVLHSRLSVGERYDTWQRLRSGEAGIVIGARSAVFAPVADPGIFIIDEEQEFTYKQEESPRYHTREVARRRGELAGAVVLMGSATPSVESYQLAREGKHRLLTMPDRIDGAFLPEVRIVDMREELRDGRRSVLSEPLAELLAETVAKGEQAIVLLNRRGYATFVLCRECGHVMRCRHCAVSLVYHASGGSLRCHYCGGHDRVPDVCPACGSRYIKYFGTGTQKVEEELAALLPQARIIRMDQDTTGKKLAHDRILSAFASGRYDILLGTQMVAKGHDIANVTAVGIVTADTALHLPDFRAAERTFMLLTQAAGRAGRGDRPGRVVVQTYNAEHYAIEAGAKHDYDAFFRQEIECRRELGYPPFSDLIKLTVQGADEIKARRQAEEIGAALKVRLAGLPATSLVGPFAASVAKLKDLYRLQLLIKTGDLAEVRTVLADFGLHLRSDVAVDVGPLNVL